MSLDVNKFKAQLREGGARPNLFKVILTFPSYVTGNSEQFSFLCKSASLPASTLGVISVPFRGRENIDFAGDRSFEPWNVSVYNTVDFALRDAFMAWHNGINDRETNKSSVGVGDIYVDAKVQQLNTDETVAKEYEFKAMFPETVGAIELSYDSGNQIETFDVTLRYLYWN